MRYQNFWSFTAQYSNSHRKRMPNLAHSALLNLAFLWLIYSFQPDATFATSPQSWAPGLSSADLAAIEPGSAVCKPRPYHHGPHGQHVAGASKLVVYRGQQTWSWAAAYYLVRFTWGSTADCPQYINNQSSWSLKWIATPSHFWCVVNSPITTCNRFIVDRTVSNHTWTSYRFHENPQQKIHISQISAKIDVHLLDVRIKPRVSAFQTP